MASTATSPAGELPYRWFPDNASDARVATSALHYPLAMRNGVAVLGNFDGVHLGHRRLIELASDIAGRGHVPVVAMSAEPHPVSFFARGPQRFRLACPRTKVELLADHGVDFVYSPLFDRAFASMSPADFVHRVLAGVLSASHVVVGDDFHFGAGRAGNPENLRELATSCSIPVSVVPEVIVDGMRCSSSNIRAFIGEGRMRRAAQMLGYPWHFLADASRTGSLSWRLAPMPDLLLPAEGVYPVTIRTPNLGERAVEARLFVEGGQLALETRCSTFGLHHSSFLIEMFEDRL